jgi:hypothetical protein
MVKLSKLAIFLKQRLKCWTVRFVKLEISNIQTVTKLTKMLTSFSSSHISEICNNDTRCHRFLRSTECLPKAIC